MTQIEMAFFDVGGVLLSNGWDHAERARAVERFHFDKALFEAKHERWAPELERGVIGLDEYLARTIFDDARPCAPAEFRDYMFSLSEAKPDSLAVLAELAAAGRARLATLNNEGRELNEFRIAKFELSRYFSLFCSSCYLGERKPGAAIYRRALGLVQLPPSACLFVDDREENVATARTLGFDTIHFESAPQLRAALATRGLLPDS